jgi:triosephosphate isomerase
MKRPLIFAANWKMNVGPAEAEGYFKTFLAGFKTSTNRSLWFFPPDVSIPAVAHAVRRRRGISVGVQDVYWEPEGAFTGATSPRLARDAGAMLALVGHSERRHVFGEMDEATGRKVRAVLEERMTPVLCVGETLSQRQRHETNAVVRHQLLAALGGLSPAQLKDIVVAYEPVWAVGSGHNATPADAAAVHREIRTWIKGQGARHSARILYGGSVRRDNVGALLSEPELDGVLVGGASLKPAEWRAIVETTGFTGS